MLAGLKSLAGASGAGNSVTITNNGTIQTSGSAAHGIYAVSQGGGGGNGSDATITHSSTQGGAGSGRGEPRYRDCQRNDLPPAAITLAAGRRLPPVSAATAAREATAATPATRKPAVRAASAVL